MTTEDIVALIARQEYLTAQLKVQVLKDPIVKEDTFTALTNLLKVSEALDDGICENLGIEYVVKLRMGQF
jgi:hypothetical protein